MHGMGWDGMHGGLDAHLQNEHMCDVVPRVREQDVHTQAKHCRRHAS